MATPRAGAAAGGLHGGHGELAEAGQIDSLRQRVRRSAGRDGAERLSDLVALARAFDRAKNDSALHYVALGLATPAVREDPSLRSALLAVALSRHTSAMRFDSVAAVVARELVRARRAGDSLLVVGLLERRAVAARRQMRFDDAAGALLRALRILGGEGFPPGKTATVYNALSRVYTQQGDHRLALASARRADSLGVAFPEAVGRVQRGMAIYFVGTGCMQVGDVDGAEDAMRRYRAFSEERGGNAALGHMGNHGPLTLFLRDSALAERHLLASLGRARGRGEPQAIAIAACNLAEFYVATGREAAGLALAHEARLRSAGERETENSALATLHSAHAALGRPDSAYLYLARYNALHDSLRLAAQAARLDELAVAYDTRAKEAELTAQTARLATAETEKRALLLLLGLGVVGVATIVALHRQRLRLTQDLADQRGELIERERQEHRRELELSRIRDMLDGQEAERRRVAQDLHDGLGGLLASTRAHLLADDRHAGSAEGHAGTAVDLLDRAYREVRRIAHAMMPQALAMDTFTGAVDDLLAELEAGGIAVQLDVIGPIDDALGQSARITLYRILQELCANVVKHAGAREVVVQLIASASEVSLVFEDDGRGFAVGPGAAPPAGLGLQGLRSRVNLLQGTLDVNSVVGRGTSVTINFPRAAPSAPDAHTAANAPRSRTRAYRNA